MTTSCRATLKIKICVRKSDVFSARNITKCRLIHILERNGVSLNKDESAVKNYCKSNLQAKLILNVFYIHKSF